MLFYQQCYSNAIHKSRQKKNDPIEKPNKTYIEIGVVAALVIYIIEKKQ